MSKSKTMCEFKIIHLVSSIDVSTGGPARSITAIVQGLLDNSTCKCLILTGASPFPELGLLSRPKETVEYFQIGTFGRFKNLNISNIIEDGTVLHGHGMWELSTNQLCRAAVKNNLPYVISPHGMLEPWALKQGSLKKKIALWVYQFNDLKNASCIHATSLLEAENIWNLGLKNPIAVIPNGINLTDIAPVSVKQNNRARKALFLSRIHPKKGIENLLDAWGALPENIKKEWSLDIVGNGEEGYLKKLNSKINELKLQNQVSIIGPLYDDKKNLAYQSADLFVLPTYSENFGMVVAEAMAFGLPVITTKGTPWEELETHNAGWWIEIGVKQLTHALTEAMQKSTETLIQMGANGRKLVEQNYSIEAVSTKMIQMYTWIINPSMPKPDFIYIK